MKEKRTEAKGKERKRRETKEQITLFIPYKICVFLCGCSFAFNFNEMKCKRELNANNNPQQRHTTNPGFIILFIIFFVLLFLLLCLFVMKSTKKTKEKRTKRPRRED